MLASFEEAVKSICSNSFMRITVKNFSRYEPFRKDYVTSKYGKLPGDDAEVLCVLSPAEYGAFIRIVCKTIPTKTCRLIIRFKDLAALCGVRPFRLKEYMHAYFTCGLIDVVVCQAELKAKPVRKSQASQKSVQPLLSIVEPLVEFQPIFYTERHTAPDKRPVNARQSPNRRPTDALRKDLTDLIERKNISNPYGSRTESEQQIKTKTELIKTPYISPKTAVDNLDVRMTYDSLRKEIIRTPEFIDGVVKYLLGIRIWHDWRNSAEKYPGEEELREKLGPILRVVYEYGYRGLTLAEWKSPDKARKLLRQRIIDHCGKQSVTNWGFPDPIQESTILLFEKSVIERNEHA